VALALDNRNPRASAQALANTLSQEQWIAAVEVTGPGYLTVTVTDEALVAVANTVIAAGQDCVASDALQGQSVPSAPTGDPLAAPTGELARAVLSAHLTGRLAAAAGATVADFSNNERPVVSLGTSAADVPARPEPGSSGERRDELRPEGTTGRFGELAEAVAYAGRDAVTFTLARAVPGKPLQVDPQIMARHVVANPAYAVRYAHARAASGVRWAATSSAADTIGTEGDRRLLDALSWLPERVATAARRGRPDEFARYLEDLASVTIDVLSSVSHPGTGAPPGSGRLTLAKAARTGLAAGLGLLEVSAPERL
jgi:arginyl-tRNA synthetase